MEKGVGYAMATRKIDSNKNPIFHANRNGSIRYPYVNDFE